jgi:hypothetical protein
MRARAETANRDPLVLREVVAIGDEHPGHIHQGFIESPRGLGLADLAAIHGLNRIRDSRQLPLGAGDGDRRGRERDGLGGVWDLLSRERDGDETEQDGCAEHV